MIETIDMHLRDFRLLDWLTKHNNERIPAHVIAKEMCCHENTVLAMVKRLESAGYIDVKRSTRGGHLYRVKTAKCS